MNLNKLRGKIDALDSKIIELFNERANVVKEIGVIKNRKNAQIYAPDREKQVFEKVSEKNKGPLGDKCLFAIYRELMAGSIMLERPVKVSYLGPEGTFSYFAAKEKFGSSIEYIPLNGIDSVFREVESERADYGVVPVENTTEGGIRETLNMFIECDVKVCAEIITPVHHNLMAKCKKSEIKKIYSKPQALFQCKLWLANNFQKVDLLDIGSTAEAAKIASKEKYSAAIAHSEVARIYGLKILRRNIEDYANNITRFFILSREFPPRTGNDKTAIMCHTKNESGALFKILEPFKKHGISLADIEPLPTRKKAWDYCFFIDFAGHAYDEKVKRALKEVGKRCIDMKVMGSFPVDSVKR
ncbi:MAG: prephenate dehydratase [Candidatus Scalindua sp.]|jgi:chorismate mutase/prephenate dehydratase|nr:prephenate dehydratase [Candidatus Scalindua sp.]MBT5306348.1 prephenate dehydratase [Candidatus Scalindua sp.]MBT6226639.1 prephenate dehydratase [Candidatus Scalindua sp.]MBT6564188.1 prephenate dehydratase [Candidatus Scalindua sp.]MBT7210770.1 prephenate dehydratase [Candidatus Scalindua sp.]